jgi:tol-pal system protein YbgF
MKSSLSLMLLACAILFFNACASTTDVASLQSQVSALQQDVAKINDRNKQNASTNLKLEEEVKADLQEVRAQVDQNQFAVEKQLKDIKQQLAGLGAGKPSATTPGADGLAPAPPPALDPEEVYAEAYNFYKQGKLPESRQAFQGFLTQFPQTEYSDNAQFWIGECFFKEGKYEEAILAYEDVVKKFPRGNKVPDALLKQGLCFGSLGDKTSSRILFQRVIDRFPQSPQAETARREIEKLS